MQLAVTAMASRMTLAEVLRETAMNFYSPGGVFAQEAGGIT